MKKPTSIRPSTRSPKSAVLAVSLADRSINSLAIVLPFAAVIIGLHAFHSAWLAITMYHAGIVAVLAGRGPGNLTRMVRSGLAVPQLLVLSIVAALTLPGLLVLWPTIRLGDPPLSTRLAEIGLSGASMHLFAIYFVLVHPALEEIHWRGFLASPERGLSPRDTAFAAYHMLVLVLFVEPVWVFAAFVVLSGMAWAWRRVAWVGGGLAVPIVSHVIADAAVIVAVEALTRGKAWP